MVSLCGECSLGLYTGSLQQFIELSTLADRNDIVFLAMEDNDRWIVFVDIVYSTESYIFVRFLVQL